MTIVEFLTARLDEEAAAWSGGTNLITQPQFAKLSRYMLADIAAKRAIITHCMDTIEGEPDNAWYDGGSPIDLAKDVLKLLASVYADHPDYQGERLT